MERRDYSAFMRKYGVGFVLLLMVVAMLVVSPVFRTWSNALSVLLQVAINGILALGMVFVITAGGIDLSIGSMLALAGSIVGVMLTQDPTNIPAACLLAVAACTAFGLVNGVLVARFNMFPFVVTLSTQLVIRGLAYIVTGGYSLTLTSKPFRQIGGGKLFDVIPYPVIVFTLLAIFAFILLHKTKFGRYIYAVGGNMTAAIASGVNVFWTRVWSFVIMGFGAGIAGVIMASRISAGQPNIGTGYETDAIAACVIGGTSFSGGISTIPGTVIGVLIIGVIYNAMNLLRINTYWQTIAKGLLIIGAVMLDMLMTRRRK
ncbi:MAG: ABC transporter permease [Clostridiales bacterium]|nr:ABC transporter permease [Clostridiales bacterium]